MLLICEPIRDLIDLCSTLWLSRNWLSNPLWQCECSDAVQLYSAASGILKPVPAWQLDKSPVDTCVNCTSVKQEGIGTSLNMSCPPLQAGLYLQRRSWCLSNTYPQELLLLLHLNQCRGLAWHSYRSVTRTCAQEYHFPHQATVRHWAQERRTDDDFDEQIFICDDINVGRDFSCWSANIYSAVCFSLLLVHMKT